MTSGRPCPKDDFEATTVGYGPTALDIVSGEIKLGAGVWDGYDSTNRNSATSDGWFTRTAEGAGFFYANEWSAALSVLSVTDWVEYYKGSLPGDSGGPLLRMGGNSEQDLLCGVCSGHQVTFADSILGSVILDDFLPAIALTDIETRYPAIDASETENFLRPILFDSRGNLHGTCSPTLRPAGSTVVPGQETDSDGDMIPDACDPCQNVADPQYRRTGTFSLADADEDGVPDACDTCPTSPFVDQSDSDGDGLGDACDSCGDSGISDIVCCSVGLSGQCGKAGTCVGSVVGSPGGCAEAGFSGRCSEAMDEDADGVPNNCDNCPLTKNANVGALGNVLPQADWDGDGLGDACDGCDGREPRLFPELQPTALLSAIAGLRNCDPTAGPNAPAPANLLCQMQTGNPNSRCVVRRVPSGQPDGVCTLSGVDSDKDGVWDLCDNCKNVPNPGQENCNIEAEMVETPSEYPYLGDACDRTPCAYVRSLYNASTGASQIPTADGVGLLEVRPILLPPSTTGAPNTPYPLKSNQNPRSLVGNSFCSCGNNDGQTHQPWECRDVAAGGCKISPASYSLSPNGNWQKPDLSPQATPGQPISSPPVPFSQLPNLPTSNASNQPFPQLDQGSVSLVHWDTSTLPGGNFVLAAPPDGLTQQCSNGEGAQGVFWTSVRNIHNLQISPTELNALDDLSSHYEFAQWGSLPACVGINAPGQFFYKPCIFCENLGFRSVAGFSIFINPADITRRLVVASEGGLSKILGELPHLVGGLDLGETLEVSASDGFHTPRPGPDFMLVKNDGTSVTGAIELQKQGFASLLPTTRVPGAGLLANAAVSKASPLAPPPRQEPLLALSKRLGVLFMGGGAAAGQLMSDLWRYDLGAQTWSPIPLQGQGLGEVLAMTFHGPEGMLYVVDEKKLGWFHVGRVLRINPDTGAAELVGAWPRLRAFDEIFLSVAESGDLVLTASQDKTKKGRHMVMVFAVESGGLQVRWSVSDHGAMAGPAMLTKDGLTRPFTSPSQQAKRFTPTSALPSKPSGKIGDCF